MSGERRGKGRNLTSEELALWQAVAASVAPLHRRRKTAAARLAAQTSEPTAAASSPTKPLLSPEPLRPQTRRTPAVPQPTPQPVLVAPDSQRKPKKPPLAPFEARSARRLATGKLAIDATLDLHGMRQAEAHTALRAFLASAQRRGFRNVKVITGKGRATDETAAFDLFDDRRGVLRDKVPHWLADADLRDIVVSFTTAGRSHGGSGALYVRLRKR